MIEFQSGSSNAVNSGAAVAECIERAFPDGNAADCSVLIIHATVGHNFAQMSAAAREACPGAQIVGCTGSGVIGREGVSEAMRAMAVMAVTGEEVAVAVADGLNGENSQNLGEQVAGEIKAAQAGVNMAFILTAGLNLSGDRIIDGIESVFGAELPIFGATAADSGKGARTFQFHNERVLEEAVILVGFADPTLEVLSAVHHGSIPVEGAIFEVTKSRDNRVIELDGKPAWPTLLERLGLDAMETEPSDVLPIVGLGMTLDEGDQEVYDNPQILRVPLNISEDRQTFCLPTSVPEGTRYQLMARDEQYIFDGVERMMERMMTDLDGKRPVAVFHADCMARGRAMFNKVLKDEIIAKMQYPLCGEDVVPWLGVYGFSEYCRFAGKNRFHSYTTSLFPIVRNAGA